MRLDLGVVINPGQAEAEELEELRAVTGDVGFGREVIGGDARPDFADGILDFGPHFQVVDPHAARETTIHLDLDAIGAGDSFVVHDEITGQDWTWAQHNYVRLDPYQEPAHVLTVRSPR